MVTYGRAAISHFQASSRMGYREMADEESKSEENTILLKSTKARDTGSLLHPLLCLIPVDLSEVGQSRIALVCTVQNTNSET